MYLTKNIRFFERNPANFGNNNLKEPFHFIFLMFLLAILTYSYKYLDKLFYINNTGSAFNAIPGQDCNIIEAWRRNLTGSSVHIQIVDHGCYLYHNQFNGRVIWDNCKNLLDGTQAVLTTKSEKCTNLMGILGASHEYDGMIGIASNSSLSAIAYQSKYSTNEYTRAINFSNADILLISAENRDQDSFRVSLELDNSIEMMNNGRMIVIPCGDNAKNGIQSSQNPLSSNHRVFTIGSASVRSEVASYSQVSPEMLVHGISDGQNSPNALPLMFSTSYEKNISEIVGGTSASAAEVSGILALMKEAKPTITYLEASFIMALTATQSDPQHPMWITNAAGYKHSPVYGFGRIDAGLAVIAASEWNIQLDHQYVTNIDRNVYDLPCGQQNETIISFNVIDSYMLYFVSLTFNISSNSIDGLSIELLSPTGTRVPLLYPTKTSEGSNHERIHFRVSTRAFFGEGSTGIWKAIIKRQSVWSYDKIEYAELSLNGVKHCTLPRFNRRIPADVSKRFQINPANTLVMKSNDIDISQPFEFKLETTIDNNPYGELTTFFVEVSPLQRKYTIGNIFAVRNETLSIQVPRIFKNGLLYNYVVRTVDGKKRWIENITIINKINGPISPAPFEVILKEPHMLNLSINLKWSRQENMPEPEQFIHSFVALYDIDSKKVVHSQMIVDIGEVNITMPTSILSQKMVFSVSPMKMGTPNNCQTFLFPVIFSDTTTSPISKFDHNFSNSMCLSSQPSIITPNNNIYYYLAGSILLITAICLVFVFIKSPKQDNLSSSVKHPLVL